MLASSRSLHVCTNFPFFGLLAESSLVKSVCGSGTLRTQKLHLRALSSLLQESLSSAGHVSQLS